MNSAALLLCLTLAVARGHPLLGSLLGENHNDVTRHSSNSEVTSADASSSHNVESGGTEDSSADAYSGMTEDGTSYNGESRIEKKNSHLKEVSKEERSKHHTKTNVRENNENTRVGLLGSSNSEKITERDTTDTKDITIRNHQTDKEAVVKRKSTSGESGDGSHKYSDQSEERTNTTKDKLQIDNETDTVKTKEITKERKKSAGIGGILSLDNSSKKTVTETREEKRRRHQKNESTRTDHQVSRNHVDENTGDGSKTSNIYEKSDGYSDSSSSADTSEDYVSTLKKTQSESERTSLSLLGKQVDLLSSGDDKSGLINDGLL